MIKKILLLIIAVVLTGCGPAFGPPTPTPFRLFQGPTVELPTPMPTNLPTTTSTLVMNDPWTPTPVPSATPLPEEAFGLIADIVDAQTVRVVLQGDSLNQIYTVRLIGVDPLPNVSSQPWGVVAYEQINHWLGGKVVRLVQDTTVADSSGVLPRYVYLNEDDMINLMMIEMGLARPSFQSPDTEFQTEFQQAADNAEADQRGLWGPAPTATPTRTPTVEGEEPEQATPTMTTTPALTITPAVDTTAATATPAAAATLTATTVITAPVP